MPRVFLLAGEYSASPQSLASRRNREFLRSWSADEGKPEHNRRLFFRHPEGKDRTRPATPAEWHKAIFEGAEGAMEPISLSDLLASAAHRALCSFHDLVGERSYHETLEHVTHLIVSSMPGLDPNERLNLGLLPQRLRATLKLDRGCQCHFQVGTSDSGAWAFAEAVRIARASEGATILITAAQIIPPGYAAQYHIRSVLDQADQRSGLDMLAVGDLLMDVLRRTHGVSRREVGDLLQAVRQRKLAASRNYPAAMRSDEKSSEGKSRTPYFSDTDMAPPCCGAAAAIVTSNQELLEIVAREGTQRVGERYPDELLPVVEVMGVGEGSSNPSLVGRKASLSMAPAIRQALAATADDAKLPASVFAASAFAVLHDAFPSIELAFLLSLGLDWDAAAYRMQRPWPNPYGGLVTFGHALGASGLVQVVKSLHIFTKDRRHVHHQGLGDEDEYNFPRRGAFAFTTSVGGPLSHIVVTLLRGGNEPGSKSTLYLPPPLPEAGIGEELKGWRTKRSELHHSTEVYAQRLQDYVRSQTGGDGWLVEGVSMVDVRSCIDALKAEDLPWVELVGMKDHGGDQVAEIVREQLRLLLQSRDWEGAHPLTSYDDMIDQVVETCAEEGAIPEDQLPRYRQGTDTETFVQSLESLKLLLRGKQLEEYRQAINPLLRRWKTGPDLAPAAPAKPPQYAAVGKLLKNALRLHLALLLGASPDGKLQRKVAYITAEKYRELDGGNDIVYWRDGDYHVLQESDKLLPWWHTRATRDQPKHALPHKATDAGELFGELHDLSRLPFRSERVEDLEFLRTYFTPLVPPIAIELKMRDAKPPARDQRPSPQVPIIFYVNDIRNSQGAKEPRTSYAVLGEGANAARGWLGRYRMTSVQSGDSVQIVCFDDRLRHGEKAMQESIVSVARFARDYAQWSLRYGLQLRSAVSVGDGGFYNDVNGTETVASEAQVRAARLLAAIKNMEDQKVQAWCIDGPSIAFDLTGIKTAENEEAVLRRQLEGWTLHGGGVQDIKIDRPERIVRVAVWVLKKQEGG